MNPLMLMSATSTGSAAVTMVASRKAVVIVVSKTRGTGSIKSLWKAGASEESIDFNRFYHLYC
jgi:hypothetical protein